MVLFPTPPFPLATTMVFFTFGIRRFCGSPPRLGISGSFVRVRGKPYGSRRTPEFSQCHNHRHTTLLTRGFSCRRLGKTRNPRLSISDITQVAELQIPTLSPHRSKNTFSPTRNTTAATTYTFNTTPAQNNLRTCGHTGRHPLPRGGKATRWRSFAESRPRP